MKKEWLITNKIKSNHLWIGGFSLVEAVLSSAVFALLVTVFVGMYLYGQESTVLAGNRSRAVMLAEEGLEAVRNIRDENFTNLVDGTYGLSTTGNQWNLSGPSDINGIFTRAITVSSIDATRKNITADVTWQQNEQRSGSISLNTYLNDWKRFVMGDWSNPSEASTINLPNIVISKKIQVLGNYAYMIKGGGSPNFFVINISDPDISTVTGTLALSGTPQNIFISGNYAYIASGLNSGELQIVDISNPATPIIVGTYNAFNTSDAIGIFVSGTTVYLVRTNGELLLIDISVPSSPVLIGSVNTSGSIAYEVYVSGNYAYIASNDDTQELNIVDISNPADPFLVSGLNLPGTTDAKTISLVGSNVFIGQGNILYIVDISIPTSPVQVSSINVLGTLNDIAINTANNYIFVGTSDTSNEFKVINVADLLSPVILGQVNLLSVAWGVSYSPTLDRAFVADQVNNSEFISITPEL